MQDPKTQLERSNFMRGLLRHPVARNTVALYAIQFAGYVMPLVTLPYLARVLHAQAFGLLLFSQSFALWASITFEYGFNFSATREVAQNRGNSEALAEIAAGVLGAKLILISGFLVLSCVAALTVENFYQHPGYLAWAMLQALAFGLSNFWFFQGTERVVVVVLMQLFTRAVATLAIFFVVHSPGDGWKALASQAAAGCILVLVATLWMYREIGFRSLSLEASVRALRQGWNMFLFRSAYNVYGSANAFILGLFVPSLQVGYFGGAERIAKAAQGLTVPFTQALYPHMSRLVSDDPPKASRLARWTIPIAGAAGLALAGALALYASQFVSLILGRGYEASIQVLYVFALVLALEAVNEALIMHWMLPRGMERTVGAVTLGSVFINLISASVLAPLFAHIGMAWAVLIAETFQLSTLSLILFRRGLAEVRDVSTVVSIQVEH